jgi:hypothetical protein
VKNNGHRGLGVAIYQRHQVWLSWLHYSGVSNFSITAEMLVASTNGPIYAPIRLQHNRSIDTVYYYRFQILTAASIEMTAF